MYKIRRNIEIRTQSFHTRTSSSSFVSQNDPDESSMRLRRVARGIVGRYLDRHSRVRATKSWHQTALLQKSHASASTYAHQTTSHTRAVPPPARTHLTALDHHLPPVALPRLPLQNSNHASSPTRAQKGTRPSHPYPRNQINEYDSTWKSASSYN